MYEQDVLDLLIKALERHDPTRTETLTTGALHTILTEARKLADAQEEDRIKIEDAALGACRDNYGGDV